MVFEPVMGASVRWAKFKFKLLCPLVNLIGCGASSKAKAEIGNGEPDKCRFNGACAWCQR